MDIYSPPTEPGVFDQSAYSGPWIRVNQAVLLFIGAIYLIFGVFLGGIYTILPLVLMADEPDAIVMLPVGILMFVCCGGVGILNLVAAWGLGAHKMWGWVLSLILGAMYIGSACMPFGAVLLYGLVIDEPTRKVFLK